MSDFMRSTMRPRPDVQQGSQEESAPRVVDRIRDTLAVRCPRMEALAPEVLDLDAEFVAELHAGLAGRVSTTAGMRSPKYAREQGLGIHPYASVDLAWLAINAPTALRPGLAHLVRACGDRIVIPHDVILPASVYEAHAALLESAGTFHAAVARAVPGRTAEEFTAVQQQAEKCERRWVALRELLRKAIA